MDLLGGLCGTLFASLLGAGEESPASSVQPSAGFAGGSGHSVRSPIQKRWPPSRDDDDGETAALIAFLLGDD